MDIKELLGRDFVILDGGFGTEMIKLGITPEDKPELLVFTHPELVKQVHKSYVDAGSDIIYANTFNATPMKLKDSGHTVDEAVSVAVKLAREAVGDRDVLVGLDVSTLGQLLEPTGTMTFEEAYESYKEIVIAGKNAGVDLIAFETFTDLYELKAGVLAAKENTDLPVFATMTFEENGRTFTGCSVSSAVLTLEGLGVDAVGVNCALGPDQLGDIVDDFLSWAHIPVIMKANAGLPDPETNTFSISAEDYAQMIRPYAEKGVKFIGGCCGTSPQYISEIRKAISGIKPTAPAVRKTPAVCSSSVTVELDQPRIIGERINPTGKKLFKEALKNNDIDYILRQAMEQVHAGADILDVNVGLPDIDEKEMMVRVVKAVQSVTDTPLQLDSTDPAVLEAGLRVYNGKAIINSVNGEKKSLEEILPLAKKYGAAVVGLTLDENGIPKKAEDRVKIAGRILAQAEAMGIRRENVFIDCLTLTASVEQEAAAETLAAVKYVTDNLGLKTVLGVSNISFGLPNRELVNHTFLTMALANGLTLPIINPNVASMTGVVRAFKVLNAIDKNSAEYVAAYNNSAPQTVADTKREVTLEQMICDGMKADASAETEKLLLQTDATELINGTLIPILDRVGVKFEKGEIFLPQLILAADTAGVCFDVIKKKLSSENSTSVSKGKIIVATVKGDIHDIGKNIVKTILENYGYDVIDLGKDVPEMTVVNAAIENDVHLIGLSALMTTTLGAMENTIKLLRENNVDCKVMVGGAVLTADYAEKIGADYYAKDAKESADIAKAFFGD